MASEVQHDAESPDAKTWGAAVAIDAMVLPDKSTSVQIEAAPRSEGSPLIVTRSEVAGASKDLAAKYPNQKRQGTKGLQPSCPCDSLSFKATRVASKDEGQIVTCTCAHGACLAAGRTAPSATPSALHSSLHPTTPPVVCPRSQLDGDIRDPRCCSVRPYCPEGPAHHDPLRRHCLSGHCLSHSAPVSLPNPSRDTARAQIKAPYHHAQPDALLHPPTPRSRLV